MNQSNDKIARALAEQGAIIRHGKSGSVLSVDLRQCDSKPDAVRISNLAVFERLRELYLSPCRIGENEIQTICNLSRLQTLSLKDCEISEAQINQLSSLQQLKLLILSASQVSEQFLADFRKVMIATRIVLQ